MPNFPSLEDYEQLVYGLPQKYPEIAFSSLRVYTTGRGTALLRGSVSFRNGLELRVLETLDFVAGCISDYSYDVLHNNDPVRWYDPQPHPDNPDLASTFPHHRHEPPEIKQNRRPAPGISFTAPNLPTLIADCEELGKTSLGNVSPE